jgi:sulfatase modifying factor 1
MNQRNEFVNQQLAKLNSLLEQWERYQVTARDPGEKEHSKTEIKRIKQLILEYEQELKGGATVDEKAQQPLIAPAIRKNNRKWILGIIIVSLLIIAGIFIYSKATEAAPDYSKYLNYLNQGDSLVNANNYPEAKRSYKKALEYNPGDSAAIKKIAYLKKADDLIAQNKYAEAKAMFKIIIEIPASPALANNKTATKENNTGTGGPLQISFTWKDGMLIIKISGGTPFADNAAPYQIEGLNCKDCIEWAPVDNGFSGKIKKEKVTNLSIRIKDSKGVSTSAQIPAYSASAEDPKENTPTVTKPGNTDEENFKTLVETGDKNFSDNKFADALANYQAALAIKPATKSVEQKIQECNKKIADEKLNAAKNIPKVNIPAGSFTMGNDNGFPVDRPEHTVKLAAFAMSKTEVTVAQYRTYCNFTNKAMPAAPAAGWVEENPVTNISWDEARSYCEWVGGRLPTEAEWEYAAKEGGSSDKNYSGSNDAGKVAVFKDNSGNKPAKVSQKQANAFGLYDLSGNVSEWCSDWFGAKYYATAEQVNPKGPGSGKEKVIRGGAFNSSTSSTKDGNQLRVTYRNEREPSVRENYIGFRVAWTR